ncbi:MAG: translocation/assembly module TamB domain-containing protein [Bacteroidales bacterium]|nr:translocation/assembly module TamB domain-containing protein [Bacteroidales bacterium]
MQTYIIEKLTEKLSDDLNTRVSIEKVDLNWYLDLVLKGVYAEDRNNDTLLYAEKIKVDVDRIDRGDNHIFVDKIKFQRSVINLRKYKDDTTINLQLFINYFRTPKPDSLRTKWNISCKGLAIENTRFTYSNHNKPFKDNGIEPNHLVINNLTTDIEHIHLERDTVTAKINHLGLQEHKGFELEHLAAVVKYSPAGILANNLRIKTNNSNLAMNLKLNHEDNKPLRDFVDKVNMDILFEPSRLYMGDLAFFVPGIYGMDNTIDLEGTVSGKVKRIRARDFKFVIGKHTRFAGNIDMTGLPDIKETFIHLSADKFESSASDITNIKLPAGKTLKVPAMAWKLGRFRIEGKFTGFYNDFVSYADFYTNLGHIATDIALKSQPDNQVLAYNGKLSTNNFHLGRLTGSDELGTMDLKAEVKGSGLSQKTVDLALTGQIDSLVFRNNSYDSINISGNLAEQRFNGKLAIFDNLIKLDFNGLVDFGGDLPIYDFNAIIDSAWITKLNLANRDTTAILSTRINTDFIGKDPDNMRGTITIDSTYFIEKEKTYELSKLDISIDGRSKTRKFLRMQSDAFEVDVDGNYTISDLGKSFSSFINHYMPSLKLKYQSQKVSNQVVNLDVTIKESKKLTDIFLPTLSISPGTRLRVQFDTRDSLLRVFGKSDLIKLGKYQLDDWYLTSRSYEGGVMLKTGTRELILKDKGKRKRDTLVLGMDDFIFSTDLRADTVHYFVSWNDPLEASKNKGEITGFVDLSTYPKVGMKITQADMLVNDTSWTIKPGNYLEIDSSSITVRDYDIRTAEQRLQMNGKFAKDATEDFDMDFENLSLSNFDLFFRTAGIDMDGRIDGQATISNVYEAPKFTSDLEIESFAFNHRTLGDARIITIWNPSKQSLDVNMEVIYEGNAGKSMPLSVKGFYYPEKENDKIDLDIELQNLKLGFLYPFLNSFLANLKGYGSGTMHLGGTLKKPKLTGEVNAMRTELMIGYTKVTYSLADNIIFNPTEIVFDNITVYDSLGNRGTVNGSVYHDYFKNFRPDMSIEAENLSGLNLSSDQNEMFYGQARATGIVRIYQLGDNLYINTNVTSDEGTDIVIPITYATDVSSKDFIKFVGSNNKEGKEEDEVDYEVDLSGIVMNLELEVTPEANIKLYLPYQMGNLEMTGSGDIRMEVGTTGGFNMFGEYQIDEGEFLFQLENMISRTFSIGEGSSIRWSGDPYNGLLNVNAVYRTRPSLSSIPMYSEMQEYNERIPVNAIVKLRNELSNPDISFSLGIPDVDEQTRRLVYSAVDTSNQAEMSRQMISLLVLNNFSFSASNAGIASSVGSSSFDLISSQVSNWLSQISSEVDVGVNYRPGTDISTEELEVALSTQLFNNRVIIDGNVGYLGDEPNRSNASNLVGDVNVEVKLTKDGRLRLKAFNKSNNIYLFDTYAPYTQGVGVSYRKEFDTFRELLGIGKEELPDSLQTRNKQKQ